MLLLHPNSFLKNILLGGYDGCDSLKANSNNSYSNLKTFEANHKEFPCSDVHGFAADVGVNAQVGKVAAN